MHRYKKLSEPQTKQTTRHMLRKLVKTSLKEKIVKAARGERCIIIT